MPAGCRSICEFTEKNPDLFTGILLPVRVPLLTLSCRSWLAQGFHFFCSIARGGHEHYGTAEALCDYPWGHVPRVLPVSPIPERDNMLTQSIGSFLVQLKE